MYKIKEKKRAEKQTDVFKQADEQAKELRKKFEKEKRAQEMVIKYKEKRDLWIGHKLGNVITDVQIDKAASREACLIQYCK